jgi:hypothetical protein
MPVTVGSTGIVTKGLRNNLEAIRGSDSIDSLQKKDILGISHIMGLRNVFGGGGSPLVLM